jgi:glutathione S-transferase
MPPAVCCAPRRGRVPGRLPEVVVAGSVLTKRYRVMEMLNFAATEVHKQICMLFNPKMTPAIREFQLSNIERRLNALDRMFEGRQYAAGNRFSIVDPYLFVALNWSNRLALDLGRRPNIKPYVARVAARPKVQETMRAEGLIG